MFIKHDVTNYIYIEGPVDVRAALGEPGQPDRLSRAADSHAEGRRARHAQGARAGQGEEGAVRDRVDVGGLRRSARAPAEGNLLGQRQPDRPARRLRRGEALRRGDDDGVSPVPRAGREDRPHLQHLRTAHAAPRRPRRSGVHVPGAARRGRDDFRRRHADAQLLLRQRSRRRDSAADGLEPERAGEHRQPVAR